MKWYGCLAVAAAVLWLAPLAAAHPEHEHRLMGALTAVSEHEIEVETIEKEKVKVATTDETIYESGGAAAVRSDLQVGNRIVVFYTAAEDEQLKRAVRILLPQSSGAVSGEA